MTISFIDKVEATSTDEDVVISGAPTGTADDDVMIGVYYHGDDQAFALSLTGFTEIFSKEDAAGNDHTSGLWYKVAASESGSYTMNGTAAGVDSCGAMLTFRGVDTSTPIDVTFVEGSHYIKEVDNASPTPQPITTVTDGAWVIVLANGTLDDASGAATLSGYTERANIDGGFHQHMTVLSKEVATAGVETPGALSWTGVGATEDTVIMTIALRPAATGINAGVMRRRR